MKKGSSIELGDIAKSISKFFYRFHIVLFVVVVLGGMSVLILMLSNTIAIATNEDLPSTSPQSFFDRETISQLEKINTGEPRLDPNFTRQLESGKRVNPFVE